MSCVFSYDKILFNSFFDGDNVLKIYKVRQFIKKVKYKISLICSFPHFWICALIIILSGVSLLASYCFYRLHRDYLSSIMANIFAGLLTGLIICMISGVKQFYVARLRNRKNWLEHIRQMISDYNNLFHELINKKFTAYNGDEALFSFIYDVGSYANWVNDDILQSTYDKLLSFNPREYCKKYLDYDAYTLENDFSELHDNLYELDINYPSKEEILRYFEKVHKCLMRLNSNAYRQLEDINIKLEETNKSII